MAKYRKHHLFFGLLLGVLPLLTAASNYTFFDYDYSNFEFDVISETPHPESEEASIYEFNFKNNGNSYILKFEYKKEDIRFSDSIRFVDDTSPITNDLLLKPHSEIYQEFVYTKGNDFSKGSMKGVAFAHNAFEIDDLPQVTISKSEKEKQYVINADISDMSDEYNYSFAITMTYDTKEYCFKAFLSEDNKLAFVSRDDTFDISKANITEIKAFQEKIYRPNYAGFAIGGVLYALLIYVLPAILVGLIILVTVIIIVRYKKRANNK